MVVKHVVEILHFAGCPNVERAREAVAGAIAAVSLAEPVEVRLIEVTDDEQARRLGFLGSPTVRVDSVDADPSSLDRDDFGLQCRIYVTEKGIVGCPPAEWIARMLS